jgi:hypothetical protein
VRRPRRLVGPPPDELELRPPVDADSAAAALRDSDRIALLLDEARTDKPSLGTARDLDYLRWRYAPLLDYRAFHEEQAGRLRGLVIFRVNALGPGVWDAMVAELIVRPGDSATATRLLRRVLEAARVEMLFCHCSFSPESAQARAAGECGFRPSYRVTFVVHPLGSEVVPGLTDLDSWALSLGDLEGLI